MWRAGLQLFNDSAHILLMHYFGNTSNNRSDQATALWSHCNHTEEKTVVVTTVNYEKHETGYIEMDNAIRMCIYKEIKVITTNTDRYQNEKVIMYVGERNYDVAYETCAVVRKLGIHIAGRTQILCTNCIPSLEDRYRGIQDCMKHENVSVTKFTDSATIDCNDDIFIFALSQADYYLIDVKCQTRKRKMSVGDALPTNVNGNYHGQSAYVQGMTAAGTAIAVDTAKETWEAPIGNPTGAQSSFISEGAERNYTNISLQNGYTLYYQRSPYVGIKAIVWLHGTNGNGKEPWKNHQMSPLFQNLHSLNYTIFSIAKPRNAFGKLSFSNTDSCNAQWFYRMEQCSEGCGSCVASNSTFLPISKDSDPFDETQDYIALRNVSDIINGMGCTELTFIGWSAGAFMATRVGLREALYRTYNTTRIFYQDIKSIVSYAGGLHDVDESVKNDSHVWEAFPPIMFVKNKDDYVVPYTSNFSDQYFRRMTNNYSRYDLTRCWWEQRMWEKWVWYIRHNNSVTETPLNRMGITTTTWCDNHLAWPVKKNNDMLNFISR